MRQQETILKINNVLAWIKNGESWNQNEQVDSKTSYNLANMNKTIAILTYIQ